MLTVNIVFNLIRVVYATHAINFCFKNYQSGDALSNTYDLNYLTIYTFDKSPRFNASLT